MSTIWTPGGEHPVPPASGTPPSGPPTSGQPGSGPAGAEGAQGAGPTAPPGPDTVDPRMAEEFAEQLAEARQRLLSEPIDVLVANHVMGLYELAAIHLSAETPDLEAARLPIDAMGILVDGLGDRLAEHATLQSALQQIRLAYVQLSRPDPAGHEDGPA